MRVCASIALVALMAVAMPTSVSPSLGDRPPQGDIGARGDLLPNVALHAEPVIPTWIGVTASIFERMKKELRTQAVCLAEAMYHEARGEGLEGEKAVAEVVLHRAASGDFPGTICGVINEGLEHAACQFAFACDGSRSRPKDRSAWIQVRDLAEKILSGKVRLANITGGATAFHALGVAPAWAEAMHKTAQIGRHVFYRPDPQPMTRMAQLKSRGPLPEDRPQTTHLRPSLAAELEASGQIQSEVDVAGAVRQGT